MLKRTEIHTPKLRSSFMGKEIRMIYTVKAFGQSIGMWTLSNKWQWEHHSIMIEPDERRPAVSIVEFVFSQSMKPEHDDRLLAVLFESLTLQ